MRMLSPFTTKDWSWPRRSLSSEIAGEVWDDFDTIVNSLLRPTVARSVNFQPSCDIEETKDHYLVTFDMPGLKKEDISIEVKNNQLSISGERHQQNSGSAALRHERMYGKFERTFMLPETINADKIEANYEDGVLKVALPKAEAAKSRRIEIKTGQESFFDKLLGGKEKNREASTEIKDVKEIKVS